jgi:hypothetical protein
MTHHRCSNSRYWTEIYQQVIAEYAYGFDQKQAARFADVFTDDGVLDLTGIGSASFVGKPAITAFAVARFQALQGQMGLHTTSNLQIKTLDRCNGTATVQSTALLARGPSDRSAPPTISALIVYTDDLVQVNGVWKIKRRIGTNPP